MADFVLDDLYLDDLAAQEQSEMERARQLQADTQNKKSQQQGNLAGKVQEAEALVVKLKKIRNVYRAINIGSGITLVGLAITFLVMNWQLFMSGVEGISMINGLGKIFGVKFVPSLSIPEFIFLLFLWLVVIILAGFLAAVVYYFDKCGGMTGTVAGWSLSNLPFGTTECAQFFK